MKLFWAVLFFFSVGGKHSWAAWIPIIFPHKKWRAFMSNKVGVGWAPIKQFFGRLNFYPPNFLGLLKSSNIAFWGGGLGISMLFEVAEGGTEICVAWVGYGTFGRSSPQKRAEPSRCPRWISPKHLVIGFSGIYLDIGSI